MTLYLNPRTGVHEFRYKTDPKVQLKDYGPNPPNAQWAIFVPDGCASTTDKWYLTVRPITTFEMEATAVGPVTMSWVVKELDSDMISVVEVCDVVHRDMVCCNVIVISETSSDPQALMVPVHVTDRAGHSWSHPIDNVGVIMSSVKSSFVDSDGA
ncbi:hypothetical protein EUX98_g8737 [Antrodiella citrinella]|uniref:Uncharacterized protein n=1 Tax=Antrodiella citrinella TaxID=2447956 RepID=A0A4S4M3E6_9APHY|nr:hypothetical protein EUX98_g8737 [Antrodiella citrinella]